MKLFYIIQRVPDIKLPLYTATMMLAFPDKSPKICSAKNITHLRTVLVPSRECKKKQQPSMNIQCEQYKWFV